jgi:hypothetical protein
MVEKENFYLTISDFEGKHQNGEIEIGKGLNIRSLSTIMNMKPVFYEIESVEEAKKGDIFALRTTKKIKTELAKRRFSFIKEIKQFFFCKFGYPFTMSRA